MAGDAVRKWLLISPFVVGGRRCSHSQPHAAPFVVYDDNSHGLAAELRLQAFEALFTHNVLQPGGYYFWRNDPRSPEQQNTTLLFGRSLYQLYCEVAGEEQNIGRDKMVRAFNPEVLPPSLLSAPNASVCSNYSVEEGVWGVGCDAEWCFLQKSPLNVTRIWNGTYLIKRRLSAFPPRGGKVKRRKT